MVWISQECHFIPVENKRIFLGYSLVYSLPFLYNIFLPFCTLFISFLCLLDVYKQVGLYYSFYQFNKEKHYFLLSFHMVSEPWKARVRVLPWFKLWQPI